MKIKKGKEQQWEEFVKVNSKDGYSLGIIRYTRKWANLMEIKMQEGCQLKDIANETSNTADTEGITGFMYGCAVKSLAEFWEYGEELRQWHNGVYGYKGKGVVNPAIITVDTEAKK